MKRLLMVWAVAALMVALMVLMAAPAMANVSIGGGGIHSGHLHGIHFGHHHNDNDISVSFGGVSIEQD